MDERELARIRFVTERFRELQGLRELPGVASAVLLGAGLLWRIRVAPGRFQADLMLLAVLASGLFVSAGLNAAIDTYYRRRFGKATIERHVRAPVVHLVAFFVAMSIDLALGHAIPVVTFTGAVSVPLFIVIRDWRPRLSTSPR